MSCGNCDQSKFSVGPTKTSKKIDQLQREQVPFSQNNLFSLKSVARDSSLPKLSLSSNALNTLFSNKQNNISMNLPGPGGVILKLLLTKVELYSPGFTITDGSKILDIPKGVHYFGVIEGKEDSKVVMNIFQDQVTGLIRYDNQSLELFRDASARDFSTYQMIHSAYVPFHCKAERSNLIQRVETQRITSREVLTKYIRLQLEVFNSNSTIATTIFAAVADIYLNDPDLELIVQLAGITLWADGTGPVGSTGSPPPFTISSNIGENFLRYSEYRTFNTLSNVDDYQLGVTVEQPRGGVAWLDKLCKFDSFQGPTGPIYEGPFGVCDITFTTTSLPPTFEWNSRCIAHEFGHNIGSFHTFDCVWAGETGLGGGGVGVTGSNSLGGCDNDPATGCIECGGNPQPGGCDQPGIGYVYTSVNGATGYTGKTIMGYCFPTSGQEMNPNFSVFGPQPAALMKERVLAASCLPVIGPTGPTISEVERCLERAKRNLKKAKYSRNPKKDLRKACKCLKCAYRKLKIIYDSDPREQYKLALEEICKAQRLISKALCDCHLIRKIIRRIETALELIKVEN